MPLPIVISHDSRDRPIATVIANTLTRITLNGFKVWYSSDTTPTGGVTVGSVWLDELRQRLSEARAVIVLLTPLSINRPWIIFESGYVFANPDCEVIPVALGIDSLNHIPFPLGIIQSYQLADYDSLKNFAAHILHHFDIKFDEEMCKPILKSAIAEITNAMPPSIDEASLPEPKTRELISEINTHIEDSFNGLYNRLARFLNSEDTSQEAFEYSVAFHFNLKEMKGTHFLEIDSDNTVQDILDNLYYMLEPHVEAFTYLYSWMVRNVKTNKNLIIREISDVIPAYTVFNQGSEWEVIELKHPYCPTDSSDSDRWYKTNGDW